MKRRLVGMALILAISLTSVLAQACTTGQTTAISPAQSAALSTATPVPSEPTVTPLELPTSLRPNPTRDPRCAFASVPASGFLYDDDLDPGFWQRSTPEEQGLDPEILSEGLAELQTYPGLFSMLIVRGDTLVIERYYHDASRFLSYNIASASKSILSTLVGIAIEQGYIEGVEQRVSDIFPQYFEAAANWSKKEITLEHLLTMSAGLAWGEEDSDNIRQIERSGNWVQAIVDFPLAREPGLSWNYNTGLTHLMSAVIAETSGMSTCEFAHLYLFGPLDISVEYWLKDPQGVHAGGWKMYITPRELAKLGLLYLHEGQWQGQQIVPAAWVRESFRRHMFARDDFGYGYWWWLQTIGEYPIYSAWGYGGQMVHIIPGLDMVVVTTADGGYEGSSQYFDSFDFLERYIIPAATPGPPE